MRSKAEFLGHPIHQMVIALPLGLLATSATFDVIGSFTKNRRLTEASYYIMGTGVLTGVASAVPGAIDFWAVPSRTRANRIGWLHGVGNVIVTGLFAASWLARRRRSGRASGLATTLSTTGALLALGTAWLGGELVDQLGIGVHEGANLNAPSSISNKAPRKPIASSPLQAGEIANTI